MYFSLKESQFLCCVNYLQGFKRHVHPPPPLSHTGPGQSLTWYSWDHNLVHFSLIIFCNKPLKNFALRPCDSLCCFPLSLGRNTLYPDCEELFIHWNSPLQKHRRLNSRLTACTIVTFHFFFYIIIRAITVFITISVKWRMSTLSKKSSKDK